MHLSALGLGVVCSAMLAAPAHAQTAVDGRVVLVRELSIIETRNLDFGVIIGTAAGTVNMTATATPTCTPSAGLIHVQDCRPAEFIGKGSNNQIVRIKKPNANRIVLTGPGANMRITQLVLDGSPQLTLVQATSGFSRYRITSPTGFFTFRLAGILNVGANQAPGVYTGTFQIDINYD